VFLSYLFSAFLQFDNSLLLADKTAMSNLEFILYRHSPPQHLSCYTLSRVQWIGNVVLASKKKNYNLALRHLRL